MTRCPRLLTHDLRERARLSPASLSLTVNMSPLSGAVMTLARAEAEIRTGDWVEVFSPSESTGIFRATCVETACETGLQTVRLEHGFGALADHIVFERPGGEDAPECAPAGEVLRALLTGSGGLWTLGECDYDEDVPVPEANTNLLAAVLGVSGALEDSRWVFDQRALPWRASLVRMAADEVPACEMRMARSIASMRLTLDRTDMATRIYPQGQAGLTIAEVNGGVPYVEENVDQWGVIAWADLDVNETDPERLKRSAQAKLRACSSPKVTVEIDGLDLSQDTGEALDRLTVGRICRVPLRAYGTVVTQRIVSLCWPDVMRAPRRVKVTMATPRATLSAMTGAGLERQRVQSYQASARNAKAMQGIHSIVRQQQSALASAETGITQNAEAIELWARRTTTCEGRLEEAEAGITITADAVTTTADRVTTLEGWQTTASAELRVQADQISAAVTRVDAHDGRMDTMQSAITQTAGAITAEVTRATEAEGVIASHVTQTADSITAEVTRATEAEGIIGSRITQTADSITAEVTRATGAEEALASRLTITENSIAAQAQTISAQAQTISLKADRIELDGYVTASELDAVSATITNLQAGLSSFTNVVCSGSGSFGSLMVGSQTCAVHRLTIGSKGGYVYAPTDLSFDWSDIDEVQDAISAARSEGASGVTLSAAGWQNGSNVVSASNGRSVTVGLPAFQVSSTAWASHKTTVNFSTQGVSSPLKSLTVDATSEYNAGVSAGSGAVTIPAANIVRNRSDAYNSTTHNTSVQIKATASNGASNTQTFTVDGSSAYNAGSAAGYNSGYSDGVAAGGASGVTISSVEYLPDTWVYDEDYRGFTVSFRATASNGATKTETIHDTLYNCYNAGYSSGAGSVDISTHSVSTIGDERVMTIRLSNGKVRSYAV